MNQPLEASNKSASRWAVISMIAFAVMFGSFGFAGKISGIIYVTAWAAVLSHLALLPVVAAFPAPPWAKVGGYSWAVFDTILNIVALNGAPMETIMPWRLGLHVAVAVWPLGAAITNTGIVRWIGILFAASLAIVPLLGPGAPPQAMFIAVPFIFLWLGVCAWKLR